MTGWEKAACLARLPSRAKDLGSQLSRDEASKDSPATESATICLVEFSVVAARVFILDLERWAATCAG